MKKVRKRLTASIHIANILAMQQGREQLGAWRERAKLKHYELAGLLKITKAYMSQVMSGKRRPSLPIAVRIEALTGVPVASWVPTGRGRSKSARKDSAIRESVSGV